MLSTYRVIRVHASSAFFKSSRQPGLRASASRDPEYAVGLVGRRRTWDAVHPQAYFLVSGRRGRRSYGNMLEATGKPRHGCLLWQRAITFQILPVLVSS